MIETLTGLRGLALLMVVAAGLAAAGFLPSEFGSGLDQLGLMIVVVVAGYLVALHHFDESWNRHSVGEFLLRRAKRLLPLYYLAIALSAAITGWWSDWPFRIDSMPVAIRALLLVEAPGALWIVPVLAQLYVLFAILWWMRERRWHPVAFLAVGLLACVALFAAPFFLAGVAVGAFWRDRIEPFLRERATVVSVVGAVAFVLVCVDLPAVRMAHGWTFGQGLQSATWADPISGLVVVALVVAAAALPVSLAVLSSAPMRVIGRVFYPVYLVVPVLVAVAR